MDKTITVLLKEKLNILCMVNILINQINFMHMMKKMRLMKVMLFEITEHKPISKSKSWVVTKVVSKAQG